MLNIRHIITPILALALALTPVLCCCAEAQTFSVVDAPQTQSLSKTSSCSHCPLDEESTNQEPAPHDPGDCGCDTTLTTPTASIELKLTPAVELPLALSFTVRSLEQAGFTEIPQARMWPGDPPRHALRERLSLLCVLRI